MDSLSHLVTAVLSSSLDFGVNRSILDFEADSVVVYDRGHAVEIRVRLEGEGLGLRVRV